MKSRTTFKKERCAAADAVFFEQTQAIHRHCSPCRVKIELYTHAAAAAAAHEKKREEKKKDIKRTGEIPLTKETQPTLRALSVP